MKEFKTLKKKEKKQNTNNKIKLFLQYVYLMFTNSVYKKTKRFL